MSHPPVQSPTVSPGIRLTWALSYADSTGNVFPFTGDTQIAPASNEIDHVGGTFSNAGGVVTLWDATVSNTESFSFLYLECSGGFIDIEFDADTDGSTGARATYTVRLFPAVPLVLGADDAYANITGGNALGTGTLDLIERIRALVPAGGDNSTVRGFVAR